MKTTNESARQIQLAIANAADAGAHNVHVDMNRERTIVSDDRREDQPSQTIIAGDPEGWYDVTNDIASHVAPPKCQVTIIDNSYAGEDTLELQMTSLSDTVLEEEQTSDGVFKCRLVPMKRLRAVTIVLLDGTTISPPRLAISHPNAFLVKSEAPGSEVDERQFALVAVAQRPVEQIPFSSMTELETMLQLLFVRHLRNTNAAGSAIMHPGKLTARDLRETARWASLVNPAAAEIGHHLEHMPQPPRLCSVRTRERPYTWYMTAPENAVTIGGRDTRDYELRVLAQHSKEFPLTVVQAETGDYPLAAIAGAQVTFEDGTVRHFDAKSPVPVDDPAWRTEGDRFEAVQEIRVTIEVRSADGTRQAETYETNSTVWSAQDKQGHLLLYTREGAAEREIVSRMGGSWYRGDLEQPESVGDYAFQDPDRKSVV